MRYGAKSNLSFAKPKLFHFSKMITKNTDICRGRDGSKVDVMGFIKLVLKYEMVIYISIGNDYRCHYTEWGLFSSKADEIYKWNLEDESMAQMESQIEAELIEESITTNRQGDRRVNRI